MTNKKGSIPLGILLIASFYAFGAVTLLAFLFINPGQAASVVAQRHGLPDSTGIWILPIIAGLALLISFGLYTLSRWGYVLTILYLIYFVSVNVLLFGTRTDLLFFGNLIWSFLVILCLLISRKRFLTKSKIGPTQDIIKPSQN